MYRAPAAAAPRIIRRPGTGYHAGRGRARKSRVGVLRLVLIGGVFYPVEAQLDVIAHPFG